MLLLVERLDQLFNDISTQKHEFQIQLDQNKKKYLGPVNGIDH